MTIFDQDRDEPSGPKRGLRRGVRRLLSSWLGRTVAGLTVLAVGAAVPWLVTQGLEGVRTWLRPPFVVGVQANADRIVTNGATGGTTYLIPKPIQSIPAPPDNSRDCYGRYDWAHGLGGVDTVSRVRVTVQARTSATVLVSSFEPVVVRRSAAMLGSVVTCPGRGGPVDVRELEVDLDQGSWQYSAAQKQEPAAPPTTGQAGTGHPTTPGASQKAFAFTVSEHDPEVFDIAASSPSGASTVEWTGRLTLVVDGKTKIVTIDDHGEPFVTTGTVNARTYMWSPTEQRWRAVTDGDGGDTGSPSGGNPAATAHHAARVQPCRLLTAQELQAAIHVPVTASASPNFRLQGAEVDLDSIQCDYASRSNGPPVATVMFQTADDARQAKLEFDSQKRQALAAGTKWQQLPGLGDEAFVAMHTVLARKGAELLLVGLGKDASDQVVAQLAAGAARRAWA